MFLRNAWYCAGWDHEVSQAHDCLVAKTIAGEPIVLYRKPDGAVVAMEDRCCHRQAPLSLGRKEGDSLRCMYHGWRFSPQGRCVEIPGQPRIPEGACIRTLPVVEKENWVWVWMGDPERADPALICDSVGPSNPDWNIRASQIRVNTNYRLEIANLCDLSHIAYVHDATFGGTTAYSGARAKQTVRSRGLDTDMWLRNVPPPRFAAHLFPTEARFDLHFDVKMTVPCNFIMHFRAFTAGAATEGPSDGQLVLDTFTSQAITPRDSDSVDYYYAWGASKQTDAPGLGDMLLQANDEAFLEDKRILEGQYQRMKQRPDFKTVDYAHDSGPGKMLWVLDKLLKEEATCEATS